MGGIGSFWKGNVMKAMTEVKEKAAAQKAQTSSGLGQVGEEEEQAKKDKKKANTIRKNRAGTRGAAVPLQSTSTISGDASTKGVQI